VTPSAKSQRAGLEPWRCDILYVAVDALLGVGAVFVLWTLLDSVKPSADVQALSTTEVELAPIQVGQGVTVLWQGKPMFIDHGTPRVIGQVEPTARAQPCLIPQKMQRV
jgi:ubiquinol-cytochrome c reductase iron-sulfur subunit